MGGALVNRPVEGGEASRFNRAIELTVPQEYGTGTREEFISNCKAGKYNDVVVIYRSNESTSVGFP
jgi:hypothetical protein